MTKLIGDKDTGRAKCLRIKLADGHDLLLSMEYIQSLTKDELVKIAMELSKDCARLRRELDDLSGVIR